MSGAGVLEGVRVIDFTQMLSGPFCTMLLADHGAEVVKIEPFGGETTRSNGPFLPGEAESDLGGYFQSVNRNKRSLVLDLRSDAGRRIVLDLAAQAHVVVSNFRLGVMERLGLSYAALTEVNPRLVYASISGFGSPAFGDSAYRDWPAYDVVAQAMGGVMGITGPNGGPPTKVGPGVGDIFPGALLAFAIVAALRRAERDGAGQQIEVAMYDATIALCERAVYQHSYTGHSPGPEGSLHPFLAPFGLFEASDGWVAIAAQNDNFWFILADIMGRPDLKTAQGFLDKPVRTRNRDAVNAVVAAWTATRSKAELTALLGGRIPFGPVQTAAEIAADPHVAARNMRVEVEEDEGRKVALAGTPVKFSVTPAGRMRRAPHLGEHGGAILAELGYAAETVDDLKRSGVMA